MTCHDDDFLSLFGCTLLAYTNLLPTVFFRSAFLKWTVPHLTFLAKLLCCFPPEYLIFNCCYYLLFVFSMHGRMACQGAFSVWLHPVEVHKVRQAFPYTTKETHHFVHCFCRLAQHFGKAGCRIKFNASPLTLHFGFQIFNSYYLFFLTSRNDMRPRFFHSLSGWEYLKMSPFITL